MSGLAGASLGIYLYAMVQARCIVSGLPYHLLLLLFVTYLPKGFPVIGRKK